MNSDTITGAAAPLTSQFEMTRPAEEPAVPELDLADEIETGISDEKETEAGLLRLTEFIKRKKTDLRNKTARIIQAYETAKHFKARQELGTFLNRHQ